MNTAIARDSTGIGFSIPIDIARPLMRQALAGQPLSRPYIGIHYVRSTPSSQGRQPAGQRGRPRLRQDDDDRRSGGHRRTARRPRPVSRRATSSPRSTDQVDRHAHPLDAVLSHYKPGDTITLTVLRGGATITIKLTLGTRPPGL